MGCYLAHFHCGCYGSTDGNWDNQLLGTRPVLERGQPSLNDGKHSKKYPTIKSDSDNGITNVAVIIRICEDDLSPEIGWTERTKCQNDNITIYSTSEIDRCFYYGDQAAICFVVGPKKPVKGQSFQVYLVDSVTYSVYYNKKHKIGSSGCGLLKEDIKAFSKGR